MSRSKKFFAVVALAAATVIGLSAPAVAAGSTAEFTISDHYTSQPPR